MKSGKLHIIFLGISGFPYRKLAAAQHSKMICKALANCGNDVIVLNKKGVFSKEMKIDPEGYYENIRYVYATGSALRQDNFVFRNLEKMTIVFRELSKIVSIHRKKSINIGIVYNRFILNILIYRIIARILNFPLVLVYVENRSGISDLSVKRERLNHIIYDRFVFNFVDGALPISTHLTGFISILKPTLPLLHLPGSSDFDKINAVTFSRNSEIPYFLYCGHLGYLPVIKFIIHSFQMVNHEKAELVLVVNGGASDKNELLNFISHIQKKSKIIILSDLPEEELYYRYKNATALLIPIRDNYQDISRFPYKVSEYVASGRPIITTNYGIIREYFRDNETAFIADDYTTSAFSEKMNMTIENPKLANKVGTAAREKLQKYFNYRSHEDRLNNFLKSLVKQ
ncbi:MAG: glycosyltransferase [Bacteroidales bacterium]|nr:glycosyltransferase [Bacteroidales bacterium]